MSSFYNGLAPMAPPSEYDNDNNNNNNNSYDQQPFASALVPAPYGSPSTSPVRPNATTATTFVPISSNNTAASSYVHPTSTSTMMPPVELSTAALTNLTQSMIDTLVRDQGYTLGITNALSKTKRAYPLRIWIVDNSGSMRMCDGCKIVQSGSDLRIESFCSRWTEMQQTIEYHARLAALIHAPTTFRLLNDPGINAGPQQFSIAVDGTNSIDQDLTVALQTIAQTVPGGGTPLVAHMKDIKQTILTMESQLRQSGTKVVVVLATDGLPTNQQGITDDNIKKEFEEVLRSMEGLPIWVVVRLFTDEEEVVEYYNEIDKKVELSIEVLDDFASEAQEIHEQNAWLTYGLQLHRLREFGCSYPILDMMDEKPLSKEEIKQYCQLVIGPGLLDEAPDPIVDWKGFLNVLEKTQELEKDRSMQTWNLIKHEKRPWIDIKKIKHIHPTGSEKCCIL